MQIAAGRDRIARAGLANIALDARSLHEIGAEDGAFDYIICHGLLSWVAEPLREALLRVVAERLAPNGVAMVSFNVLPGWRLLQVARDSLMLHARLGTERDRQALDGRRASRGAVGSEQQPIFLRPHLARRSPAGIPRRRRLCRARIL